MCFVHVWYVIALGVVTSAFYVLLAPGVACSNVTACGRGEVPILDYVLERSLWIARWESSEHAESGSCIGKGVPNTTKLVGIA